MSRFDSNFFDYFNYVKRLLEAQPFILGGTAGYSGGIGGRPGGFVGQLPQVYVAYDTSEAASDYTPANYSGASLIDNLNHIRYRLVNLENDALTVEHDNAVVLSGVTVLDFRGGVATSTGNPGEVIVTVIASGSGGISDHGLLTGLTDDDHPQYLTSGRGDLRYYTQTITDLLLARKIGQDFFQNKGDLIVGTGWQAAALLPVGVDGQILIADSTSPYGLSYVTPSSGWATVLSGIVGEGPGIDITGGGVVGLGGDTVELLDSGGNPVAEFAANSSGFDAASAAATSGDVVRAYAVTITGDHTLTANVTYEFHGTVFTGTITGGAGTKIYNINISVSANSSSEIDGFISAASGTTYLYNSNILTTQSGSGNSYAIKMAAGNIELWDCNTNGISSGGSGYGIYRIGNMGTALLESGTLRGSTAPFKEDSYTSGGFAAGISASQYLLSSAAGSYYWIDTFKWYHDMQDWPCNAVWQFSGIPAGWKGAGKVISADVMCIQGTPFFGQHNVIMPATADSNYLDYTGSNGYQAINAGETKTVTCTNSGSGNLLEISDYMDLAIFEVVSVSLDGHILYTKPTTIAATKGITLNAIQLMVADPGSIESWSDKSAWNVFDYPTRHTIEAVSGIYKNHVPLPTVSGNILRANGSGWESSTLANAGIGVTLASDADTLLGLTGQQLTLDSQTANRILAGPTSGAAADPTFRALVPADFGTAVTSGYVLTLDGAGNMSWQALPGSALSIQFMYATASADPNTYRKLLPSHSTGIKQTLSFASLTNGAVIEEFVTEVGSPGADFLLDGIYHLHIHAAKTAGTKVLQISGKIYKRTYPSGTETLLGTTDLSTALGASEAPYDLDLVLGELDVDVSDRIVVKIYATVTGAGTDPTCALYVEGDTFSRLEFPALQPGTVSSGGAGHTIQDEGVSLASRTYLNFVGSGVTVLDSAGTNSTIVTISGGGGGHTIMDEGVALTQRTKLDFVGVGVTVTDDSANDKSIVTISGITGQPVSVTKETMQIRKTLYDNTLGSAGYWDVSGIDQSYDHLEILVEGRSVQAANGDNVLLWFNNDTTDTNYRYVSLYATSGGVAGGTGDGAYFGNVPGANIADATLVGWDRIEIPYYSRTTYHKVTSSYNAYRDTDSVNYRAVTDWESAAAINRITVKTRTGTNFTAGSRLQIVGIKDKQIVTDVQNAGGEYIYGKKLLFDQTLLAAGTFDFSNIPQTYDHLEFVIEGRSAAAAASDSVYILFNGDATQANYRVGFGDVGSANGSSASNNSYVADIAGDTATANMNSFVKGDIPFYTDTNKIRNWKSVSGGRQATTAIYSWEFYGDWNSTNAINRIQFTLASAANFKAGSRCQVFGYKNMVSGVGVSSGYIGTQLFRQVAPAGGVASFDISAIPTGYDYLEITLFGNSEKATTNDNVLIAFNADTTDANYRRSYSVGGSARADASDDTRAIADVGSQADAKNTSANRIIIPGYDNTSIQKSAINVGAMRSADAGYTETFGVFWESTAAINRVTLTTISGSDFAEGTLCVVVGYKNQIIGTPGNGWIEAGEVWTYSSADDPTYQLYAAGDVTSKYSPGMRFCLTQATGGKKYFIITKVGSYDAGNARTPIDMYGGTDYDLNNEAISAPYYAMVKAPQGFPLSPSKWSVIVTDTTQRSQASPADNTWYNLGSLSITAPIGAWHGSYKVWVYGYKGSRASNAIRVTLSTANNSESDANWTVGGYSAYNAAAGVTYDYGRPCYADGYLDVAVKTPLYLNCQCFEGVAYTSIAFMNDGEKLVLKLTSSYL